MAPFTPSTDSDPPEIHVKLEELQLQKGLVNELTSRLVTAWQEVRRLEREIVEYRASVGRIQNCPEEILVMIFGIYAEHKPQSITHLLGICRRWYIAAINAPMLWNRIDVVLPNTWDMQGASLKINAMINLYLQRSASLPLHIRLDSSGMQLQYTLFLNYISKCLHDSAFSINIDAAKQHVESLDIRASPCEGMVCSPNHRYDTISSLIGHHGVHLRRWESFELILCPVPGMDREIWQRLCHQAPNLVKLVVRGIYSDPWDPYSDVWGQVGESQSLVGMVSLKELTLEGNITYLNLFGDKETSLTSLSLSWVDLRTDHHSLRLSRFVNLEHLTLVDKGLFHDDMNSPGIAMTFPRLQSLNISSTGHKAIIWVVPILNSLRVSGILSSGLPDVHAVHVYLELPALDSNPTTDLCNFFCQAISRYQEMESLTLPVAAKDIWEQYMGSILQRQEAVSSLPNITFE